MSGPPGPSEVLVAVERLRRLRSRLPELGDDGAWLAEGLGRYLDPHSGVSLEDAIGTSRRAGDDHWRSTARQVYLASQRHNGRRRVSETVAIRGTEGSNPAPSSGESPGLH